MAFRIGQKVVCVNTKPHPGCSWHGDIPLKGAIYTVRGFSATQGRQCLLLDEICNDCECCGIRGYWVARFRPITERKTDISIFERMLVPSELSNVD